MANQPLNAIALAAKYCEKKGLEFSPVQAASTPRVEPMVLLSEKPEHKLVVYLKTLGHTYAEIAELVSLSVVQVQQILVQPHAREYQFRLIEENSDDSMLNQMIDRAAAGSIAVMVQLRDDEKCPHNVRLKAAQDLLDRRLGKATIRVSQEKPRATGESVEELDRELESLRQKQQDLYGRPRLREVRIPQEAQLVDDPNAA